MADASHCVQCGSPLPANWPRGLCSRCALEGALEIEGGESKALSAVQLSTLNVQPSTTSETSGTRIGRYKLLEQIGEGGFGAVWMAEQEEPVRRRVALKIIKLGMDTKQVIARFEAERQALAMMDHPNISKVLDAGATDTGRPYFVMELVKGIRITEYCDQSNLATQERLDLFIKVCQAIQHAHQKGIIHRDIKPSNVLVTLHDGVPVPKVIDFGIAKAIEGRLTDKTLFTSFQQFIGTPAYVSPEQAEMSGLDRDTRSDIYSLGVLLYELLTGQTPFDTKELINSGLDAIRKTLREVEPPRPSTRLSTLGRVVLTTTAKHRHTEPPKLLHQIRGDLDWIVMKCLEKDRTRRYGAANGLAGDLLRHLNNQPVLARPPSALYRLQKLVHRNRTAFAAAGFAVIAAVAALIIGMRISQMSLARKGQEIVPPATASPPATVPPIREASLSESVEDIAPSGPTASTTDVKAQPLPLRLVSGVVLAEDAGQPIAGALVRVAAPSVPMRSIRQGGHKTYDGRTDADGRFEIQVPQEDTISMDAFAQGYESAGGTFMAGSRMALENLPCPSSQTQEFTIKLRPALYIAGVVVDEATRPFAGAALEATLQFADGGHGNVANTTSDADGHFEIFDFWLTPVDGARGQLTFQNPATLRTVIEDVYKLSAPERASLHVTLRRGHDVKGILTSAGGRPVARTLVEALPSAGEADYKEVLTDAEGQFLVRGLPDGEITVRAHSLTLEQKAQAKVLLAGNDAVADLRLEPVVLNNPPDRITLLGMKLADVTPELQTAYDLDYAKGVLILDPGADPERLGIGALEEGEYFWMVGNKKTANLLEMVTELLRIAELDPPLPGSIITEGHRGNIRVVYSSRHWSATQYLKPTDTDIEELKQLASRLLEKETGK